MSDYHINIFFSEEDGGYIADIPDLDACSAFGETPEQALAEVKVAKAAWLEAARESGKPIPVRVTDRRYTRLLASQESAG
jgi:predicted RNase H-like HicB family nuclease